VILPLNRPGPVSGGNLSVELEYCDGVPVCFVHASNGVGSESFSVWSWQVFNRGALPGTKIGFFCINSRSNGISTWKF